MRPAIGAACASSGEVSQRFNATQFSFIVRPNMNT
jgi:hypothetical protein